MLKQFVLLMLLECLLQTCNSSLANRPRLGRVKAETTSRVMIDKNGKPMLGGSHELVVQRVVEGYLLKVVVVKDQKPAYKYLAYPIAKESEPIVLLMEQPGEGCYWKADEQIPKNVNDMTNPVDVQTFYQPLKGPFVDKRLSSGKDDKLVLWDPGKDILEVGAVTTMKSYDNLNDGK